MQKPITLIIDDEPVAREALEALLATEHYQVESATDGLQGLERAAQLLPDVILLDVMMPGIDGYEVCRRLRADPRLATVPVLMVTALDNQDARLRGLESGADDFISKPFDRAELRARLRTITRLNRYRNLSTERARFAWIVEQTQDGYLILGEDDKILYANRQARLYLGLSDLALSGITNKKALNFLDVAASSISFSRATPGASGRRFAIHSGSIWYALKPAPPIPSGSWSTCCPQKLKIMGVCCACPTSPIASSRSKMCANFTMRSSKSSALPSLKSKSVSICCCAAQKSSISTISAIWQPMPSRGCQKLKARWTISFAI